jgi:serine/threonine-protein kinase
VSEVDWTSVAAIFADALEQPTDERAAFLAERCAGRPAVRAAVERLLAARDSAAPGFLERLDPSEITAAIASTGERIERIGPWRIVREIGRGGMGEVYLAERADGQFEQQVAIKLLRRGMDSEAILTRFLRERQILAGLDHPNIAHLLDGGIASDARPYFVMEYVDGEPITTYADAHRLSIDARLGLFRTVCDVVAYAHRNLVVHRDLKPSNILVTADGRPKLLDFGIAKLLSTTADAADATTLTIEGARLMTPAYAAPEQIHGGAMTTSTDVYGLGAVLYELLAGRQPFAGAGDRLQLPRETEPVALYAAVRRAPVGAHDGSSAGIAAARSSDPARLRRQLAGDLETIVAVALHAEPERRYLSVGELDDDLRRHHEGLPVRARPDTLGYRVSRFVGRHRYGVLAVATIVLLVMAFGVTASQQARVLAAERDRAQNEAEAAQEVADFLVGVFEVSDPMLPGFADSIRATDLLEHGAERIERDLAGQPHLQGRMLGVIGRAYANLQQIERAEPLLARAVDLQRATEGDSSAAVVAALHQLAVVQSARHEYDRAESTLREAIGIQTQIATEDATLWSLLVDLAFTIHGTGDHERGNAALADAIALFGRIPNDAFGSARSSLSRMTEMARFGIDQQVHDSVFARVVEIERRAAGERSPAVAAVFAQWAHAKTGQRDWAAADSFITRALDIHRELDSTSIAMAQLLLTKSSIERGMGDGAAAVSLRRSVLEITRARLGDDHLEVANMRANLAGSLQELGRFEESMEHLRHAIATFRRADAVNLPVVEWRLALALDATGRANESLRAFESALREFDRRFPPDYLLTANLKRDYGRVLVDAGHPANAVPILHSAIEVLGTRWGEEDYRVDMARISLGRALTALGRRGEAVETLRAALQRLEASRGSDDQWTQQAREALERSRARGTSD